MAKAKEVSGDISGYRVQEIPCCAVCRFSDINFMGQLLCERWSLLIQVESNGICPKFKKIG
jgi:hypothetical protein